jgi:glucose/arabinose dehydrogenase
VALLPEVQTGGEGGLMGIAVSPRYAVDGWVYVYYTAERENLVVRFRLGQQPETVLAGIPRGEFHNGGRIAFGPDAMLYIGTGETFETREIAQDVDSLGGKILRVTPEGKPAPGNPFPGSPVWSLGHRNVQGLAWDAKRRMYASEFGEDRFDELNLIEPGRNYGWPVVEGRSDDPRFTDPIVTWAPADASPSGIAVHGSYVYVACLRGQRLYRVRLDTLVAEPMLVGRYGRLRSVTVAADGSLWLTTSNHGGPEPAGPEDDRILRLTLSP